MKEFLINLLILLTTPFYLIGVIILAILSLGLKCGYIISNLIDKWIKFITSDYIEIYKNFKKYLKK